MTIILQLNKKNIYWAFIRYQSQESMVDNIVAAVTELIVSSWEGRHRQVKWSVTIKDENDYMEKNIKQKICWLLLPKDEV